MATSRRSLTLLPIGLDAPLAELHREQPLQMKSVQRVCMHACVSVRVHVCVHKLLYTVPVLSQFCVFECPGSSGETSHLKHSGELRKPNNLHNVSDY